MFNYHLVSPEAKTLVAHDLMTFRSFCVIKQALIAIDLWIQQTCGGGGLGDSRIVVEKHSAAIALALDQVHHP